MPVYSNFDYKPKAQTTRSSIGKGQVYIEHLSPALYLELEGVKQHLHTGVDSQILPAESTPYMVRGFKLRERVERAFVSWAGSGASAGAIDITFGTKFNEIPIVIASPASDAVDIQCVVGQITKSGFRLSWKDDTGGTWSAQSFNWVAFGL